LDRKLDNWYADSRSSYETNSRLSKEKVHDGAPAENLYGSDLHAEFLDIGYSLFKDSLTLKSQFIPADIFDTSTSSPLSQLEGKLDIIWAGSFLHLFTWDSDIAAIKRMIILLKPNKGAMIVGKQMGNVRTGEFAYPGALQGSMYLHDKDSFRKMWIRWARRRERSGTLVLRARRFQNQRGV
jgi:hypothetical protein